jgi:hypothetical protein
VLLRPTAIAAAVAALVLAVPAATPAADSGRNAEVDQYLEVVPDAGGGRAAGEEGDGRLPSAPVDTEHCLPDDGTGAVSAAAAVLFDGGPPDGGLGLALPILLALLAVAMLWAALRRRRGAAAATALLGVAILCAPAIGSEIDVGVMAGREGRDTLSSEEMARMRLGGADTVRTSLEWGLVQPERGGPLDFAYFDRFMTWASQGSLPSMEVLPILFNSPEWVTGPGKGNEPPQTRAELRAWEQFVTAAVERYEPGGGFWAEREADIEAGRLRYNPITSWQVWNEPNLSPFWTGADPDAREYARLLIATDEAIEGADPDARTVLAGMLERADAPLPMSKFLDQLYRVKGLRAHFDVLSPQPFVFVDESAALDSSLRRIRRLADRNGDEDKPIWISEIGVASAGPNTELTTDPEGQAATLRDYFRLIADRSDQYGIEKAIWFQWRDADVDPPTDRENKRWQTYTGLFDYSGEPKPAWRAFCAIARGNPGAGPLPPRARP